MKILVVLPLLALTVPAAGQTSVAPSAPVQAPGRSSAVASASTTPGVPRKRPAMAPAAATAVARKIAVRTFAMFNGM